MAGSFLFANLWGLENNIYMQTGLIMLIGLLSKTAILLTEYASTRRRQGMGIVEAALGVGTIGGMVIDTIALLFIVPVLFVIFQTLEERVKK